MATEIERKFLVVSDEWKQHSAGTPYHQGYLSRDPDRTVRVRVAGESAYLTIEGRTHGLSRQEFEYPIPALDALALLAICDGPLIEKTRYVVEHRGHRWEIDEFSGDNSGLVLAEVELLEVNEAVDLPPWVGREVSDDPRYYNSNLAVNPFCRWAMTST